jgi:hypothetical protein
MKTKEIEFMMKEVERTGVSSAKVEGGTAFIFDRKFLENALSKDSDQKKITILVHDRKFQD